jgi:hypothetical protein
MDVKPGWKTSEFWLAGLGILASAVIGLLVVYNVLNEEQAEAWGQLAIAAVALGVPVAIGMINKGYSQSRADVKSAEQWRTPIKIEDCE